MNVARQLIRARARFVIFAACAICCAVLGSSGRAHAEKVLIGSTPTGHLMWIADKKGYFDANGVDVKLLEFSSGVTASKALASGEIDLANSSEFAFVSNLLANRGLKLVASIARANSATLFARRDRGIAHVGDLPGKKIGVTRRGIGEFFLGEYLAINGIVKEDVTLVDLRAPDIVDAIAGGRIDAAITWEPFVYKSQTALGDKFVQLPEQDSYYYHFVLAGKETWLETHRSDMRGILRGLIDAEQYAAEYPQEAQQIIAERFRLDLGFVRETWTKYIREVTIQQNLISLMEREAQWLIEGGRADTGGAMDFLAVVDSEPLSDVAPDAVKLIK